MKLFLLPLALFFSSHLAFAETVLLDVRTPQEYAMSTLVDSTNIDFLSDNFRERLKGLDKSKDYKVFCRTGNRSGQATKVMKELGFKSVENIGSLQHASKKLNIACTKGC